jgi:hypothetical protein
MDQELRAYLDERFERIDRRFEQVDRRFEQMDERFERVDRRFEQVDRRFEQVDRRFEGSEETARNTLILVEDMRHQVHLIAEAFVGLSDRMDRFQQEAGAREGACVARALLPGSRHPCQVPRERRGAPPGRRHGHGPDDLGQAPAQAVAGRGVAALAPLVISAGLPKPDDL